MSYETDINSSANLVKFMGLPFHLQSKWVDRAGSLVLIGTEPSFSYLADFVKERAVLANTMYGELVRSTSDSDRDVKSVSKRKPSTPRAMGGTFSTQRVEVGEESQSKVVLFASKCPLCFGLHWLPTCEFMKAKSPKKGKRSLEKRGCAYGFSKMRCLVPGCVWKRFSVLHPAPKKENGEETPNKSQRGTARESGTSAAKGAGGAGRCSATGGGKRYIFVRIVPVVEGNDKEIVTKAFLDPGSDVTVVS